MHRQIKHYHQCYNLFVNRFTNGCNKMDHLHTSKNILITMLIVVTSWLGALDARKMYCNHWESYDQRWLNSCHKWVIQYELILQTALWRLWNLASFGICSKWIGCSNRKLWPHKLKKQITTLLIVYYNDGTFV